MSETRAVAAARGEAGGLAVFCATGCYTGYLRPYPAHWGSLAATLVAYAAASAGASMAALAIVAALMSAWSSDAAERRLGPDSRRIVIDEWAGMFLALAFTPPTIPDFVIALVLFRIFDTLKLPPVRWLEKAPGGFGVTLDDLAAALQTMIFAALLRALAGAP